MSGPTAGPALIATCRGQQLLTVSRARPAVVSSAGVTASTPTMIDERGVFVRTGSDGGSSSYRTGSWRLSCARHGSHSVDPRRLHLAWQRAGTAPTSARTVDIAALAGARA